jgi:uncharacterized membrane protein YeaQ/YmgE (transglycosylase-associated protein family)
LGQDVIQYLSISHKYISGDFENAINGVWGPLISWLLIPFLLMNIPDLFCFKILQILIGAILLIGVINFSTKLINSENKIGKEIIILFLGLIFILLYYVFFTGTPDLLLSTCIFYYLGSIISGKYLINKKYGLISGILGALAYYAKAYALPFFIIHFTFVNLYYLVKKPESKETLRFNLISGLSVTIILCSVWIILLSNKYGHFTYSTAGSYNFSIVGPEYKGIHTFRFDKLYPPINNTATSYWEDPTFLPVKKWNILNSGGDFQFYLTVIVQNIKRETFYLFAFSPLFLFLLALKIKTLNNKTIMILIASIVVYSVGYLPLFIEERFLILPQILLVIITFFLLNNINNSYFIVGKYKWLLLAVFFASVSYKPVYSLFNNFNTDKEYFILVEKLKYLHINGNFAGLSSKPLTKDWGSTLFLAYEMNSKFYGEINSKLSSDSLYYYLKKDNINYLFVWDQNKIITHPDMHGVLKTEIKFYDSNKNVMINKLVKIFYSIFNLEVTPKENTFLTLYKLD